MTLRIFQAEDLDAHAVERALVEHGGFLLEAASVRELTPPLIDEARAFFALPRGEKQRVAIERSAHFRGWSEMHNARDWREQLHFGRERPVATRGSAHDALEGPNLWPESSTFRAALLAYLTSTADLGEKLLRTIAQAAGLPETAWARTAHDGYALLKLIAYHPQPAQEAAAPRAGVAAHVDFSWLTATWQDHPGLEIRTPRGEWRLVPPHPDGLWVHPGEILEHATRGRYSATPHRVTNHSTERTRLSMPFFVNPPLAAMVPALEPRGDPMRSHATSPDPVHVHRVLSRGGPYLPLHFGQAEWRRKGQNRWCSICTEPIESEPIESKA